MDIIFIKIYNSVIALYNSSFFGVVKFLLGVYAVVLFLDVILLLIKRGVSGNLRQGMFGVDIPRDLVTKENKTKKKWREIKKRLESGDMNQYKIAILEADEIISSLIKKMGYEGDTFGDKLNGIPSGHLSCLEKLKKAHEIVNQVVRDEAFEVSREMAGEVLENFESLLTEFE